MGETLSIYRHLVFARVRADWQYRTSFVLFTLGQFLITALDFLAIAVIFGRVGTLDGWNVTEVAFLYGASTTAFGLADVFVSAVERCSQRIKDGSFDRLLLRPLGPLWQLSAEEFAFRRFGKLAQGLLVLAGALAALDLDWTPPRVATAVLMIGAGAVIFSAIFVLTSSVAFWTVDTQEFANAFTYGGTFLSQYPLGVFAPWMRRLALVTGVAFVNFVPAAYVLDRRADLAAIGLGGLPPWSPAVAAIALTLVARTVWRAGLRRYRSTGS